MGKRETTTESKKVRFSKVVVVLVLLSVVVFTVAMTAVYLKTGGIPDTLVTSFFAFAGGEAGVLGLIRFAQSKYEGSDTSC